MKMTVSKDFLHITDVDIPVLEFKTTNMTKELADASKKSLHEKQVSEAGDLKRPMICKKKRLMIHKLMRIKKCKLVKQVIQKG